MKSTATKNEITTASNVILESAMTADQLNDIATAAYYKAEARGFEPGQELSDWLEAEAEHN